LSFQDYGEGITDFGYFVTSPHNIDTKSDINAQLVTQIGGEERIGGYCAELGGAHPWSEPGDPSYLLGKRKSEPHMTTDSAASATSMTTGVKTYNSAINVAPDGAQLETIAHQMQKKGWSIGVVTNVPISHATPACAYAHNVTRNDYQDLANDLVGLKSASHPDEALPGVDVLIGCGWGELQDDDRAKQGHNYIPGNKFCPECVVEEIDHRQGGKYVVAQRMAGENGQEVLLDAAEEAVKKQSRLFGMFGVGAHLPYQTADGKYDPTRGIRTAERYSPEDLAENPTLADMATAALRVLETNKTGFWLMIECGDVDWANHNNNIDDSIGAVFSGEEAFDVVTKWVETNSTWDETAVIVTADHGHMLVVEDLEALTGKRSVSTVEKAVKH
jgi:alkaline phosphatase